MLKETGCGAVNRNLSAASRYEPTEIYEPVRVLEFGVLGFKANLDLTSGAFLGAAGTR